MYFFATGIKHPRDVSVQRPQHPDPRMHQEVATLSGEDQDLCHRLPFCSALGSFRM
jgi:hypothetical protein